MHVDEWGFGGSAPNKLMARAEGAGSERVSDPCRRHGQKLVLNYSSMFIHNWLTCKERSNLQMTLLFLNNL